MSYLSLNNWYIYDQIWNKKAGPEFMVKKHSGWATGLNKKGIYLQIKSQDRNYNEKKIQDKIFDPSPP